MTYEEYLKKRLDRLNQNNHYSIMVDTEITKIVRSHIKRLEETKMNSTSTETFHDIIAIDFELQTFPNPDVQDKFIFSATNRDDIFAFVFEGPNIADSCRKAGLFNDWEKDQKIRELEEINKNLKKHVQYHIDDKDKLIKRIYELKKELALEKAANEAQHKFIREYAGKDTEVQFNYAIDDAKEVSYAIVEKNEELAEENKKLKQEIKDDNTKILQYIRMNYKLQDEIVELKRQLKDIQATKEVVEQNLSTRASILDQAKKCVCGQREQDYGTPENNFQLIADLWNGYLFPSFLPIDKPVISATDVSMMMALMKIARIKNGGGSGDSFVDLAGYAACGGEIWASRKETN